MKTSVSIPLDQTSNVYICACVKIEKERGRQGFKKSDMTIAIFCSYLFIYLFATNFFPDWVLSMGQIELNFVLILNWIVWK